MGRRRWQGDSPKWHRRSMNFAGPRQDLAGHLSIGHGVETLPPPSSLSSRETMQVEQRPGGALSLARVRAPVGGDEISEGCWKTAVRGDV